MLRNKKRITVKCCQNLPTIETLLKQEPKKGISLRDNERESVRDRERRGAIREKLRVRERESESERETAKERER